MLILTFTQPFISDFRTDLINDDSKSACCCLNNISSRGEYSSPSDPVVRFVNTSLPEFWPESFKVRHLAWTELD